MDNQLEEKKKKLYAFIFKSAYPVFFIMLIALDYQTFTNEFGFDVGFFKDIIENIDITNINLIMILILILILFSLLFFLTSFISAILYLFIKPSIKEETTGFKSILIVSPFIIFIIQKVIFSCINAESEVIIYLSGLGILTLNSLALMIYYNHYLKDSSYRKIGINVCCFIILLILNKYFGNQMTTIMLIVLMLSIILFIITYSIYQYIEEKISEPEIEESNNTEIAPSNNTEEKRKIKILQLLTIPIIYIAIFSYIYTEFKNVNKSNWKSKITDNKSLTTDLTFNIIFNKFLLMKNNANIKIYLTKEYHQNMYNKLSDENLLMKEYDTNCNLKYYITINKEYYYLQLPNNIKLVFYYLKTNQKLMFLIEEKKFGNSLGSEFTLLSTQIEKEKINTSSTVN